MPEATRIATRILREKWRDPNDLAEELAASFRAGLSLNDIDTTEFDGRYAVKAATNEFTEDQAISGKLTIGDAETTGPAVVISHAGVGTVNTAGAVVISSTGTAGCLWMERGTASLPADVLAKFRSVGNAANPFDGVAVEYVGNGAALTVAHGGGSTAGPFYSVATNRPISVGGSGISIFGHSVVVLGNVTANNFVGNLSGTATQATLASQANSVKVGSNYISPSQETLTGVLRRVGAVPTGTMTWSQVTVQEVRYLGW